MGAISSWEKSKIHQPASGSEGAEPQQQVQGPPGRPGEDGRLAPVIPGQAGVAGATGSGSAGAPGRAGEDGRPAPVIPGSAGAAGASGIAGAPGIGVPGRPGEDARPQGMPVTTLSGDVIGTGTGPIPTTLAKGGVRFAVATGTNTYAATITPTPVSYVLGDTYEIQFTNANSGAATINLNSLGAKALQLNATALAGGELPANSSRLIVYDGTQFQIVAPSVVGISPLTTKGDVWVYGSSNTRLPIGSNGQSLFADSSQSLGLLWANGYVPSRFGSHACDDYCQGLPVAGAAPTGGSITFLTISGTGSGSGNTAVAAGHLGNAQPTTGSTAAGSVRYGIGFTTFGGAFGTLPLGNGTFETISEFQTSVALSTGTQRYYLYGGVNDSTSISAFTDGSGWFYRDDVNSGKFIMIVHVAGVQQTTANGATTVAASTWYRMRPVVDAARTKVDLYISVNGGAEVLDVTYTGSLPATSVLLGCVFEIAKSIGITATTVLLDTLEYTYILTTPR